jgi:hypothetical protein
MANVVKMGLHAVGQGLAVLAAADPDVDRRVACQRQVNLRIAGDAEALAGR